jgi:hypothetical protein
MYLCIDIPSPLAPTKQLRESLARLLKLPEQDDPDVRNAIARVQLSLKNRMEESRKD